MASSQSFFSIFLARLLQESRQDLPPPPPRITRRHLLMIFGLIYFALSLYVTSHTLSRSQFGDIFYRTTYGSMYNGTAWKPFTYRVLVPRLSRIMNDLTPQPVRETVTNWLLPLAEDEDLTQLLPWLGGLLKSDQFVYPKLMTLLLIYGSLWGYVILLQKLARKLFPDTESIALFAPVFGLLAVPSFSWPFQYIYDVPTLFLSAACFYTILIRRWAAYLGAFILACLNKETSIFILIFFSLWFYHRMPPRAYFALWTAQCMIFLAIKLTLTLTFWDNPGWFLEDSFLRTLTRDIYSSSQFARIFWIALIMLVLCFRWREKPAFLKCSLWMIPIIYGAYLVSGNAGEYRVFFDVMPLFVLLGTHTLIRGSDIDQSPVFHSLRRS